MTIFKGCVCVGAHIHMILKSLPGERQESKWKNHRQIEVRNELGQGEPSEKINKGEEGEER